jgi:UDP-2,3-diacylglucosamine pyrophosphatase LpxH
MINLAVMSDLHIGLAARSKDLCPQPPATPRKDRWKYDTKTDNSFRRRFVEFLHQKKINADYLILPGDITNNAKPQEVQLASEFILQVADALQVPHNKIVFTPGNHDLDWSVIDLSDTTGLRWRQRYDPIRFEDFHFRTLVDQGKGDIFAPPHFVVWTFDDLLVVAYNSASHDDPVGTQHIHHGLADPAHLDALRSYLDTIGHADSRLRLFLVHHHPIDFTNPIPRTPDFSLMTNAESLLNLLHEYCFDLLIHGHKHHPRFETHSTQTYPHLPILCSGSFSVEIDTRWAGTIDNQFHLVMVNRRPGSDNRITGTITSWTNNYSRGWIPSEESTSGIHHIIPFGSYVMPHELDARLEPFIKKWMETHDCILWEQVVVAFPDLKHLPLNSAIAAFKRMEQKLGRRSMHQTLKDLILY